mmetsp:Transcript_40823/g.95384  ORF Transcript_40823/g.95384 Transcript_40823/m.95384 type:complete len:254 (-) Transcript_40823:538-1299(-)
MPGIDVAVDVEDAGALGVVATVKRVGVVNVLLDGLGLDSKRGLALVEVGLEVVEVGRLGEGAACARVTCLVEGKLGAGLPEPDAAHPALQRGVCERSDLLLVVHIHARAAEGDAAELGEAFQGRRADVARDLADLTNVAPWGGAVGIVALDRVEVVHVVDQHPLVLHRLERAGLADVESLLEGAAALGCLETVAQGFEHQLRLGEAVGGATNQFRSDGGGTHVVVALHVDLGLDWGRGGHGCVEQVGVLEASK